MFLRDTWFITTYSNKAVIMIVRTLDKSLADLLSAIEFPVFVRIFPRFVTPAKDTLQITAAAVG
jgi:hypothetical protein